MGLKENFKGKSGAIFWTNLLLIFAVLIGIPVGGLYYLEEFTHHGEKIEVPNVVGQNVYEAEIILSEQGLQTEISDSIYRKDKEPGAVLVQSPIPGREVKSGRIVYLTINQRNEPLVKVPDFANNSSKREAEAKLKVMGFTLTETEYIEGLPKDLVIELRQGGRTLQAGEKIVKSRPITIVAGGGEPENDTLFADTLLTDEDFTFDEEDAEIFF